MGTADLEECDVVRDNIKIDTGETLQMHSNPSPDRTDTTLIQSACSSSVDSPSESESIEGDSEHEDRVEKSSLPVTDFYTTRKKSTKYPDWPMQNVKEPHMNDVLFGRGGGTNHHPGNKRFRQIVETKKIEYLKSKRLDKPLVALQIIREWRAQEPPGRFLKLDENTSLWHDVGDKKAREKTSQALREKAPLLRKQQEEQDVQEEIRSGVEDETPRIRAIKFDASADGKGQSANTISKGKLTRVHSLGIDYLESLASDDLKNFSWDKDEVHSLVNEKKETHKIDRSENIAYAIRGSGSRQYDSESLPSSSSPSRSSFERENSFTSYPHSAPLTHPSFRGQYSSPYPPVSVWDRSVQPLERIYKSKDYSPPSSSRNILIGDNSHDIHGEWLRHGDRISNDNFYLTDKMSAGSTNIYGDNAQSNIEIIPQTNYNFYNHHRNDSVNSTGSLIFLSSKNSPTIYYPEVVQEKSNLNFTPGTPKSPSTWNQKTTVNDTSINVAPSSVPYSYMPRPQTVKRETSHKNENLETKPHQDKRMARKKLQSRGSSIGDVKAEDVIALRNSLEHSTILDFGVDPPAFPDRNRPALSSEDRLNSVRSVQMEFSGTGVPRVPLFPPYSRQNSSHAVNVDVGMTSTPRGSSSHNESWRRSSVKREDSIQAIRQEFEGKIPISATQNHFVYPNQTIPDQQKMRPSEYENKDVPSDLLRPSWVNADLRLSSIDADIFVNAIERPSAINSDQRVSTIDTQAIMDAFNEVNAESHDQSANLDERLSSTDFPMFLDSNFSRESGLTLQHSAIKNGGAKTSNVGSKPKTDSRDEGRNLWEL